MISPQVADSILERLSVSSLGGFAFRESAMQELAALPGYNWSGIYRLEGSALRLDAFVGEPTEHTEIPVGRGVCGTAVAERSSQVISDVREISNYLACSTTTRSEIVVLIFDSAGDIWGQIDIDGHEVGAFDESDERFLAQVARLIATRLD